MLTYQFPAVFRISRHILCALGIALGLMIYFGAPVGAQVEGSAGSGAKKEEVSSDEEVSVPNLIGGSVSNTEVEKPSADPFSQEVADRLLEIPKIIDNPDAPVLQRLQFIGRYHGQYANVNSNQNGYSAWETRRVRFGVDLEFFQNFNLQSVWKFDGDNLNSDENIENQWISWRPREWFGLKLGQQKPLWSQEWSTSSNSMLTFERSLLVNQLRPSHSPGVMMSGRFGSWAYGAGWFNGEIGTDTDTVDSDFMVLNLARNFEDWFGYLDDARWRVDYMYNDGIGETDGGYRHAVSTSISGKLNRWRWMSEGIYATGNESGQDLYGLTVMPSIDLIEDKLQFVARYQIASSDGDELALQNRYETAGGVIGDGTGDFYHAIYGGLNWYIHGNRLKVMSGIEYSDMRDPNHNGGDYNGWTVFGGVRMSF